MVAQDVHSRAQVEWALWGVFVPRGPKEPSPVFKTRVKKLLDLDRTLEISSEDLGVAPFAFTETKPAGSGKGTRFETIDAFCLALALDLLDFGLKQSEIIYLLRHIRGALHDVLDEIAEDYPQVRGAPRADQFPHLPVRETKRGVAYADVGYYMIFRKVELHEAFAANPRLAKVPRIVQPSFHAGLDAAREALEKLDATRKAMIIDLAGLVIPLRSQLKRAPPLGRMAEA